MNPEDEVFYAVRDALWQEMSRVMRQLGFSPRRPAFAHPSAWQPATDVFETCSEVVVRMDIAGTRREDINVAFADGLLIVRGIRREEPPFQKTAVSRMEIDYGPFEQRISLPQKVDASAIEASYIDGFLTIRVPKSARARKRSVCIRIKE